MAISVAIFGASEKPERYAYKAQQRLMAADYPVFPISNRYTQLQGVETLASLAQLPPGVHTLTVYVSPEHLAPHRQAVLDYGFQRVIFNPGSEDESTMQALGERGVEVVEGCTLVMLSTRQF